MSWLRRHVIPVWIGRRIWPDRYHSIRGWRTHGLRSPARGIGVALYVSLPLWSAIIWLLH